MQFKDITTIPAEESIQKLSPTLSQTSNGNGNGSAADEEFIPGRYAGKRNDSEPIMQFFLDGTGYYSDVKSVHFQWEKNKEGIKIIYFNDMEEPIEAATKTAVLTSPTSFTYDKGTYNLIKESIPETYAYDKSGFSGTILIQKSDPGEDYLYVKLDTFNSQSNDKCQIAGYCEDMEGGWLCTGKMPDDEMDVYFSITFLSPDKLNLEPGSDEKRMCGKSVEYTGIYQRAKK